MIRGILVIVGTLLFGLVGSCSSEGKHAESASSHVKTISTIGELQSLVDSSHNELLIFDLYADWCGPCKILSPTYSALANDHHQRAKFFRVNVDRSPDIAGAFGVRGIPYVVFVKSGKAVTALTGVNPRESYEAIITACGNNESAASCSEKLKG